MLGRGDLLGLVLGSWFWREGLAAGDVVIKALGLSRGVFSSRRLLHSCGWLALHLHHERLIDLAV
jgi:hypothetical protein